MGVALGSREPTPHVIAETLAHTLAERPLLCDLLSQMSDTLEWNVSP